MPKFPFVINRKSKTLKAKRIKVTADSYNLALDKVLAKHQGKWVCTTFARNLIPKNSNMIISKASPISFYPKSIILKPYKLILNTMDLITAKVEAAKQSRLKGKRLFINADEEGECIISSLPAKEADNLMAIFIAGNEQPLKDYLTNEQLPTTIEPKIEPEKKTKVSKTNKPEKVMPTTKKASKKAATKKTVKKAVTTKKVEVKKSIAPVKLGKQVTLAIKEIIKRVEKGEKAYNKDSKPLPAGYLNKMVDKTKEILVSFAS